MLGCIRCRVLTSLPWHLCRLVKEDFELHGKRIKKGSTILASMLYAKACDPRMSAGDHTETSIPLHMDVHQLQASVKPERWLDDPATGKKGLRPGWEYLPFNGGARICLGQQFALTEASYTTVRMCQAFSGIESRDSNPWTEGLTLTCVNLHGAKVGLTPVES